MSPNENKPIHQNKPVYPIVTYGNPILRIVCDAVDLTEDKFETLENKLLEGITVLNGAGLAAPQVGENARFILVTDDENDTVIPMNDPEIVEVSKNELKVLEECLSLPGVRVAINRPKCIKVKYLDKEGKEVIKEFTGSTAQTIHHEMDHLNGVLIIDYATALDRKMMEKKLKLIKTYTRSLNN